MLHLLGDLVDPGTGFGWASLFLAPLLLITTAWAATRTALVKAEREGRKVATERLHEANAWNAELEKRLARVNATLVEKAALIATLEDRVTAQKEHLDRLVARTPEKLWEAVERHAAEASAVWKAEAELRESIVSDVAGKLDTILARIAAIEQEVRKPGGTGKSRREP